MEEKKKASWKLDGVSQTVTMPDGITRSFDLSELFPDFAKFNGTQQNTIAYGVKQKLSDSTARSKDEKLDSKGAVEVMATTYAGIIDNTAWTKKGGGGFSKKISKASLDEKAKESKMSSAQAQKLLESLGFTIY
jgi:hypothetical protein